MRFKSETVACGIIFMAARRCKVCALHRLLVCMLAIVICVQLSLVAKSPAQKVSVMQQSALQYHFR